jgi:hypothetical protein
VSARDQDDRDSDRTLSVRSDVGVPLRVMSWERELLLPYAQRLLRAVLEEPENESEARDPPSRPVRTRIDG